MVLPVLLSNVLARMQAGARTLRQGGGRMLGVASQVSRHDQHHCDDNCVRPQDRGEHQRRAINESVQVHSAFMMAPPNWTSPPAKQMVRQSRVRDTSEEAAKLATR